MTQQNDQKDRDPRGETIDEHILSDPSTPELTEYSELKIGSSVDRYVVVNKLGEGGMAKVFSGYDTKLGRIVALKILRSETNTADVRARLLREAQAMARLTHPNVVTVYDVGMVGDNVFLAMEYIEGTTLKKWLETLRPFREILAVLKAAGRGLAAAHAAGLVHRDFKPDNVLIGNNGRVAVSDFGIVRAEEDGAHVSAVVPSEPTQQPTAREHKQRENQGHTPVIPTTSSPLSEQLTSFGSVLGTAGYISPERALEHRDDARSDQFSFSVTLYQALYGKHPYTFHDVETYIEALEGEPAPPPQKTAVPVWIHNIVLKGLSRDPALRFASMESLLQALERDPWRSRRYLLLAASVCVLIVGIGLGYMRHIRVIKEQCRVGEQIAKRTWNEEKRVSLQQAIERTSIPDAADIVPRVLRVFDNYTARWKAAHRQVMEATLLFDKQSRQTMEQRLSCLERANDEFEELVKVLSKADATLAKNAIPTAYRLSDPATCTTGDAARVAVGLPEDPASRKIVVAAHHAMAKAQALEFADKKDQALTIVKRALKEVRKINFRRTETELMMLMANCHSDLFDAVKALHTFQDAFSVALAAGRNSVAARAAANVALKFAAKLRKPREAAIWIAIARGILERIGRDEKVEIDILKAKMEIANLEGHPESNVELTDRLIALIERVYGPSHPNVTVALTNKAFFLSNMGRHDLAVDTLKNSIELQKRLLGPENTTMILDYNNLGAELTALGRYEEARAALNQSLHLASKMGKLHAANALPLASLAVLENRLGRHSTALEIIRRGIAIIENKGGNVKILLPWFLVERGRARLVQGEASKAKADCAEVLSMQVEEGITEDQIYSPDALTCLGEAEMALGNSAQALGHLERSVSLTKRESPADLPLAQFALARALHKKGRDKARALELAQRAAQELGQLQGEKHTVAAIEAWLRKNGVQRR